MTQMTHVTQLAGSQTYHAHQQACGSIVALLVALLHKVHQSWQLVGMTTHMTQLTHVTQLAGSKTYHAHQQACGSTVGGPACVTRCTNLG
jgi:hypothetical protein